jgi:hypothetical protein
LIINIWDLEPLAPEWGDPLTGYEVFLEETEEGDPSLCIPCKRDSGKLTLFLKSEEVFVIACVMHGMTKLECVLCQ